MTRLCLATLAVALLSTCAYAGHQPIFRKQKDCPKYDACWTLDSGMEKREIGFIAKEGSQGKLWDCTIVASAVSRCAASGDVVGGDGFISVSIAGDSFAGFIEHGQDTSELKFTPSSLGTTKKAFGKYFNRRSVDMDENTKMIVDAVSRSLQKRMATRAIPIPPSGIFNLTVQPVYDQNFKTAFPGNASEVAAAGFMHAQTAFVHPTLQPAKVFLDVKDPIEYDGTLVVGSMSFVDLISHNVWDQMDPDGIPIFLTLSPDFDSFVGDYFTAEDLLCETSIKLKTTIVDFFGSERVGALRVTQAIALAMGINMDFTDEDEDDVAEPRSDSQGNNCFEIGGFMDTSVDANMWTNCSTEDFAAFIQEQGEACATYLKPYTCPEDKDTTWCPFLTKSDPTACSNAYMMERCAASCDPVCSAVLSDDLPFPSTCTRFNCTDTATMDTTADTTAASTEASPDTTSAAAMTTSMGSGSCVCPTPEPSNRDQSGPGSNSEVDCTEVCTVVRQHWGCDVSDGTLGCCKYTCRSEIIDPELKDHYDEDKSEGDDFSTNCPELYNQDDTLCDSYGGQYYCENFCRNLGK